MKKKIFFSCLILSFFLIGCLNLPRTYIQPFQTEIVQFHAPFWKRLFSFRRSLTSTSLTFDERKNLENRIEKLKAENGELNRENQRLQTQLGTQKKGDSFSPIFAEVVYRHPSSWSSSVWINVGEKDSPFIRVNSPVLSGNSLVGIVESVGKRQSLVRLITDASLVVSVRAVRGNKQKRYITELIDELVFQLSLNGDKILSLEAEEYLKTLKETLEIEADTKYLAKGELFGTSAPLWRSRSSILKGVGFNCDFEDEQGPARELRTGKPYGHFFQDAGAILIQEGDLLITTGMDGLFPPNIPVALVSTVASLKEGSASFSIEAKACAKKIKDLRAVTVLPPFRCQSEQDS